MKSPLLPSFLLFLACTISSTMVSANDAAFSGLPGTPTIFKGEHKQIRMESEKVVLTAQKAGFATNATFIFVNDSSQRVSVPMGFPELNYGDGWEEEDSKRRPSGFKRFATYVNGKKVAAKRVVLPPKDQLPSMADTWWLKTVDFAPRERKTIRVETFSEYGGSVIWGFQNALAYNFTGKNWKGLVSRSDLEIKISEPGLWSAVGETFDLQSEGEAKRWKPEVKVVNGVATISKTWKNWQANSTVYVGLWKSLPFWMMEYPNSHASLSALENTVTFRTGGEPAKLDVPVAQLPQGLVKDGIPFVSFSHLKGRLGMMAVNINEKNPAKVDSHWQAKDRTSFLNAGPIQLGFQANRKTMTVRKKGGQTVTVNLPAAPFTLRSIDTSSELYIPIVPAANAIGLNVKVENEKRRFSITRASWLR
jgi:hypothetical protein